MFESFGLAETVFATSAPKTSTGRVSVVTIAQLATQPSATVPSSPQKGKPAVSGSVGYVWVSDSFFG